MLLSALRDRLAAEQRLARTDHLTGLLNSRAFADQLEHDLRLSDRVGSTLTLAYVDWREADHSPAASVQSYSVSSLPAPTRQSRRLTT